MSLTPGAPPSSPGDLLHQSAVLRPFHIYLCCCMVCCSKAVISVMLILDAKHVSSIWTDVSLPFIQSLRYAWELHQAVWWCHSSTGCWAVQMCRGVFRGVALGAGWRSWAAGQCCR